MLINARLGSALLVGLLCGAGAFGQQNSPGARAGGRVVLDVVVAPKYGAPVGDLQQQDFSLLDNKIQRKITSFKAFTRREAPVEAIVVIDCINLDYERTIYAREQVEQFLRAEGGQLEYPVAIALATDRGEKMVAGFSTDGKALGAAVHSTDFTKRDVMFSTQYEASQRYGLSLKVLDQLVTSEAQRPGRKVIIWVSPGWPLLSGAFVELSARDVQDLFRDVVDFSTVLRQARVTLYSVNPMGAGVSNWWFYNQFVKGISKPSQVDGADLGLPVLAIQSGGLALDYDNDIAGLVRKCLSDAAPYYEISFDSPPAEKPDEYHRLEVKIAKPGLVARTRSGYYAQPFPHN